MQKHEPTDKTRAEVAALSSYGVTHEQIGLYLEVDPKTLRLHYRRELDTAKTKACAAMARRLFKAAEDGSVAAMIFWLKSQARWRENHTEDLAPTAKREPIEYEIID